MRSKKDKIDDDELEAQGVGIADLLEALRNDIDESQKRLATSDKEAMFDVEDVEVEVAVNISRKTSGSGGVQVTVLGFIGAGAKGSHERGREATNRLKLRLTPRNALAGGVAGKREASEEDG